MNVWKHIKKSISVVLVFALLVQIFPLSAFAVKAEPPETATQTEEIVKDTDESPAIAGEVEELRGESEKHFLMEDGTYRAVTYEFPVHYLDEEENWQDIDNTLQAVAIMRSVCLYRMIWTRKLLRLPPIPKFFRLNRRNRKARRNCLL